MGKLKSRIDYEKVRNARILENQARLESLGIHKAVSNLRSFTSKPERKKWTKRVYETTILRRSDRLKEITLNSTKHNGDNPSLRRSNRLKSKSVEPVLLKQVKKVDVGHESDVEEEAKRPANAPLVKVKGAMELQLSPDDSARRCNGNGRGNIYDPIFGISCHFCRQKTLCCEEECKRCGGRDPDQPCIGKTDCSVCHSANGVFCRACLKVRYGQEIEKARENQKWMCPHCIEEKGINTYWICNSSFCLRKRKMAPTGLAIYKAREMGYKSVAHLLMDELRKRDRLRRRGFTPR